MRIHHLNCGTLCPIGQLFINGDGSPIARGTLVCHCLVVEGKSGLILIDTGLGTKDVENPQDSLPGGIWQAINQAQLRLDETAVAQVRALGFDPKDVRHIVLTHLDFDHAGGLPDFPDARVHVYKQEHAAAMRPRTWIEHHRYAAQQWEHEPNWVLHELEGERWMGFNMVRAIAGVDDEVLLVPLVGHSRGHCGVAVRAGTGWLFNCGDAAFHHEELDTLDRSCPLGLRVYQNVFQHDRSLRHENQQRVRELANKPKGKVQVFCSHDPEMLRRFRTPVGQSAAYLG
jgi:glyoxylase-like metal-dependent hydrolase (beta-lactamase superfamily II)